VADAAALGKIQIPAMQRNGYPTKFALGVTGAASLIAPVMPPSIPAVIFAGLAAVSTGALFAASVVPALLMALGLCIVVFLLVRRYPDIRTTQFSMQKVVETGKRVIGPLGAPVIILGGILSGAFTPTEAAAVGVAYMLLLCFFYRSLKLRDLPAVLAETVATSAAIMLIVSSASLLGYIMARERVPQMISDAIFSLTDNPTVFLLLVAIVMLILGTAIDPTAILVLTVPIILPISGQFDVDPIALGVLMILSTMIGLLTPPVGTVLYVLSAITRAPTSTVFVGALPFIVPLLVICGLIIAFPDAVIWLPQVLGL
jgi:TRAP-type transport system large permease protein